MQNLIARQHQTGAVFARLSTTALIASGTLVNTDASRMGILKGDDGSDVTLAPRVPHQLANVDLSKVELKNGASGSVLVAFVGHSG
jgi:hypothetical protein